MPERPFGWRPYTDERKAELASAGFGPDQIDAMENDNVYLPTENAVWALELGVALLHAAGRKFGPDFAKDVKRTLERRAAKLTSSEYTEDTVEGPMVANLVEAMDWDAVIARASDPDWSDENQPAEQL